MLKGKKRISWQSIFTHSLSGAATTTTVEVPVPMSDTTKDASSAASFDGARRASTSIPVAQQSVDLSLSTTTKTTTTALTVSTLKSNVDKSLPSRSSPPPSYLLDDDPFANLTPMTIGTRHRANSSVASTSSCIPRGQRPPPIHPELLPGMSLSPVPAGLQAPKSRLQVSLGAGAPEGDKIRRAKSQDGQKEEKKEESKRKRAKTFFVTMSAPVSPSKTLFVPKVPVPPLPTNSESISLPASPQLPSPSGALPPTTRAFTRMQPRPAHQRPAFAARPSLPSLDSLAKTNIVLTNKVRKGRVGAGLPFEPWDNSPEDDQQAWGGPYRSETPTTPPIPVKTPIKSEAVWDLSDVDRTPTSTPVSAAPTSPTRSTSSSTHSSTLSLLATPPPQPCALSQNVALGPLHEEVEVDSARALLWSPPLPTHPAYRADHFLASEPSGSKFSNNFVHSHGLPAPVALLPSVPEASILKTLEAENVAFHDNGMDPNRNSMEISDEEYGYFSGDLLDTYGIPSTPVSEPEFQDCRRANNLDSRSDNPEAQTTEERDLRWSVDTDDINTSPAYSSSNSYTGSVSDLSGPSHPPAYSFGYHGWSNPDMGSTTNVSRPISATSISNSSIQDDTKSNIYSNRSRSRSANSSQGSDVSSVHDSHLSSRSSAGIASSDSDTNSILQSPDSEWTFLNQQQFNPSQILDVLDGPALQRRAIVLSDVSAADHDPGTQHVDSRVDTQTSISLEDVQETAASQRNGHAIAHEKSPATAEDPFSTSSSDSAPQSTRFQQRPREYLSLVDLLHLATPSDQGSLSGTQQPILDETVLSQTSTLRPFEHLCLETEPDNLDEMNVADERLREKIAAGERDQYHFNEMQGPMLTATRPRRGSKSDGEEKRRMMLVQMQSAYSFQSSSPVGDSGAPTRYLRNKSPTSSASSAPRSNSAIPSAFASSSNHQRFPSVLSTSPGSDEEQNSVSSDDDVPLAQRIPSALTAQKTIRRQFNEEREARRAEREKRRRERQATLRPAGVDLTTLSSSQGGALHAPTSVSNPNLSNVFLGTTLSRQRSRSIHQPQIMPSMHSTQGDFTQAFKPEDLARKLQNVKIMSDTSLAATSMRFQQHQQSQMQVNHLSRSVSAQSRPSLDFPRHPTSTVSPSPAPRLRPKRSFHAPEAERRSRDPALPQGQLPLHKRSMSMGRGERGQRGNEVISPPLPSTGRPSLEDHRDRGRRVLVKAQADSKVTSPHDLERLQQSIQGTPVASAEGGMTSRHRIFIHSLQHRHMVDIRMDTSAGDLIASLEMEGVLDGWAGLGGWMIWEIAQDFGMERPVRSFELLSDIQASWLKGKTVNYFLLKKSSISSNLDSLAIPSSPPIHSGWVEWEAKKGKWSKRWLHLKENSVYISKKDGRDATLLCSLSNFDAYHITRSHRAPKPFSFSLKSTDNLSYFENTADYMHTFSCSEKNGEAWVEKILLARSYVLRQERSALFHPKSQNNATITGAAISRSGTKKSTPSKPHQPLVNLSPGDIFEPGSLLSKQ